MHTREIGAQGELLAARYLRKCGYFILDTNWYCPGGEIDIIAFCEQLVFVEVKYVTTLKHAYPHELFTSKKQQCLRRAIDFFLMRYPSYQDRWQLDLICLVRLSFKVKVFHYQNLVLDSE